MKAAIDAFYDAWTERLAAIFAGADTGGTMRQVTASLRHMEQVAVTPSAREAMALFVSIAVLEVEAAVVRAAAGDRPGRDSGFDLEAPRGSC
jgi:hypothetical protein